MSLPQRIRKFTAFVAACGMTLLLAGCGINDIPTYKQQVAAAWS